MDFSSFVVDDDNDDVISSFSENNAVETILETGCCCAFVAWCFDWRAGAWKACENGMEAAAAVRIGRKDFMVHRLSCLDLKRGRVLVNGN